MAKVAEYAAIELPLNDESNPPSKHFCREILTAYRNLKKRQTALVMRQNAIQEEIERCGNAMLALDEDGSLDAEILALDK